MSRKHMTHWMLLAAAAFVAVPALPFTALTPAAHAADEAGKSSSDEGGAKKKKEGKETEIQKHMEVIEASMKKLRRSLPKSEQNADSLKQVAEIQKAAKACVDLAPAMAANMPAGEKDKFVAAYKKDMEAFIGEVGKLEQAVKDGKNEQAVEIHKKLKELEETGHEKYNK
jgi:soluble cytochrome b562